MKPKICAESYIEPRVSPPKRFKTVTLIDFDTEFQQPTKPLTMKGLRYKIKEVEDT
jgi:hypothetical protein